MEILKALNDVISAEQIKRIKDSELYSIIVDESTDINTIKEMMIYIKYYDGKEFKIKTEFFKLISLESFTAKDMHKTLIGDYFNKFNKKMFKIVYIILELLPQK